MKTIINFVKYDDLESIEELEKALYPYEGILDIEEVKKRFSKNIYQALAARDSDNNVQGVLNIMPLTSETFEKILNGTFDEHDDLGYDNLLTLEEGLVADFYIDSLAVVNKDIEIATRLIYGLVSFARFLRKRNIKINRLATIAVTSEGENVCKKLGLELVMEEEPLLCGFVPKLYIIDLGEKNDNKSFLIRKVKGILYRQEKV